MERKMHVNHQQSSNGIDSKQRSFSDKVNDVVVSGLIDDTVKLGRSKRGIKFPKGLIKKFLKKKRLRNKKNKEEEAKIKRLRNKFLRKDRKHNEEEAGDKLEERAQDILEEAVDYFDDYDEELIRKEMEQLSQDQLNSMLIKSVKEANLDMVKECINLGANVDNKDKHGKTPLHIAAKRGLSDIAKFLIDKGADIGAFESKSLYPLHLAAANGHLDIVKYLVEKGADVDSLQGGYSYSSVLHLAAQKGHFDVVKYLIEKGANPDATDSDGKTPLQRAQEKGNVDIAEYLEGRTKKNVEAPQITEVATEKTQITEIQQIATEVPQIAESHEVTTEVPQTTTEEYSNMSLHGAAAQGNLNAVKYFVERGDDVNDNDWIVGTPLMLAVVNGHLDVVRYLLENGASLYIKSCIRNEYRFSLLHLAVRRGDLDMVKYLIEKGADVNDDDNSFSSFPLNEAVSNVDLEMVKYLVEKGANVNAMEGNWFRYQSALHLAVKRGRLDIVKYLIEKGANPEVTDSHRTTPLREAQFQGHSDIIEYLTEVAKKSTEAPQITEREQIATEVLQITEREQIATEVPQITEREQVATEVPQITEGEQIATEVPQITEDYRNMSLHGAAVSSYQNGSRNRRDVVSGNSWMNKSIFNRFRHFLPSSTGSSALLTSREYNSTTVTAIPEINTAVVNNTLLLGVFAAGLFNKTQYEHPIHENLLAPRVQSMKLNLIDEDMIIKAIQEGEEKFGDPGTDMDEVKNY